MSRFKLVLFDIDGTLLHAGGIGRAAMKRSMQEVFGTTGAVESHQFGGKTDWSILNELLADYGYSSEQLGEKIGAYSEAMSRHTAALVSDYRGKAMPGAIDLVQDFRKRDDRLIGLITGNVIGSVPVKLRMAGYEPKWFAVGAYGHESPDRNLLARLALERATQHIGREISPADVIVIGDTPADVACARAIHAVAVAVRTGFATEEELNAAQPDFLLDDLTRFREIVGIH